MNIDIIMNDNIAHAYNCAPWQIFMLLPKSYGQHISSLTNNLDIFHYSEIAHLVGKELAACHIFGELSRMLVIASIM